MNDHSLTATQQFPFSIPPEVIQKFGVHIVAFQLRFELDGRHFYSAIVSNFLPPESEHSGPLEVMFICHKKQPPNLGIGVATPEGERFFTDDDGLWWQLFLRIRSKVPKAA